MSQKVALRREFRKILSLAGPGPAAPISTGPAEDQRLTTLPAGTGNLPAAGDRW